MWNNLLGNLGQMGQGIGQAQAQYNPYQGQQAFNNNQQYYQNQAMAAQQAAAYNSAFTPKKYMIDGRHMDFEEFVNTIYPDDCAEKTMLILKFKKED